ncbi:hypothetical protein ACQEVB_27975 [Pseudonocardia sp. CA-107938]|uniref:hypothetical protein n=1 Tax=Pseudonocardia sp. CA-107938 TaxID=3240021 RepID=UPI003D9279F0
MRTTIERTGTAHATVPGQRPASDPAASDPAAGDRADLALRLVDALGRLGPVLDPAPASRDRARARIAALLAAGRPA